jgi:hypothetical protein
MIEQVLKAFAALGFKVNTLTHGVYIFYFEGRQYILFNNDNDESCLRIVTVVYTADNDTEKEYVGSLKLHQITNSFNEKIKYVKAYTEEDKVFLAYEHKIIGDINFEDVITAMILHLHTAIQCIEENLEDFDSETKTD